jgi:3-oxoacyl-[acyl-carrier-protein] synthase II
LRSLPRRVVVTGLGLVTPLGVGVQANWSALLAGRSGIGPITAFDAQAFDVRIAGQVRDFDVGVFIGRKDAKKMDPFIHYALAAARLAGDDAGLPCPLPEALGDRTGVIVGAGLGGLNTLEESLETLRTKGPRSPLAVHDSSAHHQSCAGTHLHRVRRPRAQRVRRQCLCHRRACRR